MITQNKESQNSMTSDKALQLLQEGNERFINKNRLDRNYLEQVDATSKGQFPFAVVLSCIDSRIPTEIVFDQGIGDIFNARIAGNFINEDILGSMEFACKIAGAKLIVVMGHTSCGAVKGACDNAELGHLTGLLNKLKPAVDSIETEEGVDRSSANSEFVDAVAYKNVELTIEEIKSKSSVLKEMIDAELIGITGAMYDVATGKVTFFESA